MARKRKVNKSAMIAEYLNANGDAPPSQIVAYLKENGIEATPAYVSTIKSSIRRKAAGKSAPARRSSGGGRRGRPSGGGEVAFAMLAEAKRLADKAGGIEKAKAALDA